VTRLEPDPVGVDDADDRDGNPQQARRESSDPVEGSVRWRVEDVVPVDRGYALRLIEGQELLVVHAAFPVL
jgi:hypothetical protein